MRDRALYCPTVADLALSPGQQEAVELSLQDEEAGYVDVVGDREGLMGSLRVVILQGSAGKKPGIPVLSQVV